MKEQKLHQILSSKYTYQKDNPTLISLNGNYKIFTGHQKQISLPITIKLLNLSLQTNDPSSITTYLNKLKTTKSQQVIKIYQIVTQNNFLAIVTQHITYGTLSNAMTTCKKLDQSDAIYICKYLLNGYMDLARNGVQWFGGLDDIQITDSGIKLSWNNSFNSNNAQSVDSPQIFNNTFRVVLQQISLQRLPQTQHRLLPFPESKQLKQLFRLAQSSASQISLSPIMKKKQKYMKKKFRQYLMIRQTRQTGQYFDEIVYLGVSKQHGIVKIKSFKKGAVNPTILQLNKTKTTFTKLYQLVQQSHNIYMICGYSNDGTLHNYIQRLKTSNIQLKQQQIQFFFYSMMEPLKAIQQSSIKSLSTSLHTRNIYIQSGIPKIGQPIPVSDEIKEKFMQRADVPDFYHKQYKQNPLTSDPSYDTYALGVLLHKLMFTQYPIFPQNNRVKIPVTPTFSPRLKKTLQIFLDEGGKLADIQKRIQVSETVLKQVKKNKQLLLNVKKQQEKKLKNDKKQQYDRILLSHDQDDVQKNNNKPQQSQQKDPLTHGQQQQQQVEDDCFECFVKLQLADHSIDPLVQSLQQSPYKRYRLCTKFFCLLLIYVLLMYMFYLRDNILMLTKQSALQKMNVTISTIKYEIITEDRSQFYLQFNQTSRTYSDLVAMGCMIVSSTAQQQNYWSLVQPNSIKWLSYLSSGLVMFLLIIIIKSSLIFKLDYIKTKYNYQHNITNFNYSNYLIINLLVACMINLHFEFFSIIFYTTLPACVGNKGSKIYSVVEFMLEGNQKFLYVYLPVICGMVVVTVLHFIMVYKTDTIKYSKIFSPIMIFAPFLIAYWIMVRIGVLPTYFYPTALNDTQSIIKSYFTTGDYIGILGIVPQILFLIEFLINKLIDMFYWLLIDKKRRVMIQESSTENIQLYQ